jgi:hypothetical protein
MLTIRRKIILKSLNETELLLLLNWTRNKLLTILKESVFFMNIM